ncbi:MAG: T9SS type A sorting domain-containing protein [Chitinophagaceae bacterium]|nr:T9SS type A sorting domain-containing protein [Chitinophagaceae bacterium]
MFAQCWTQPPISVSTDPDNYQNPDDPTGALKWDWRQQTWFGYRKGTPTPVYYQINSPFYDLQNPNIFDLSSQSVKNYDPKNGWELIKKDFGTNSTPIDNPYFILYNKYTGLVRLFVLITSNFQNTKSAMLTLRFRPTSSNTAGTLSQLADKSFALNNFKGKAKVSIPNQYLNGGQGSNNFFWLYGDFNTLYDPCLCKQSSLLYIESFLFSSWDVTLETNGKAETIISSDPNALTQVKNTDAGFSFGEVQTVTDGMSKGILQMTDAAGKLFTYGEKYVNTFNKLFPKKKVQDKDKESIFKQLSGGLDVFSKVGELLGLPSFLSGFVNSLVGGGKTPVTFQFAHTDINLKTTGTLTQQSQFGASTVVNPGADKTGLTPELSPVYNNKLGVFNILELPKIEYSIYGSLTAAKSKPLRTLYSPNAASQIWQSDIVANTTGNCLNNACGTFVPCPPPPKQSCGYFPKYRPDVSLPIYHYKVTSPLKFVINPASNLKLVSIKASFVFQIGKNNYPTGEGQLSPTKGRISATTGTSGPPPVSNNPEAWDEINAVGFSPDIEKVKTESELRLNKLGFDLLSRRRETDMDSSYVSTQLLPATCIENTSFLIANGFLGGEKKVSLRVSLIFEPKIPVAGSTVDKIVQTYTFDYDDASITKVTPTTPIYYTDKVNYTYMMNKGYYQTALTSNAQRLTTGDIAYNFNKGFMQVPTQLSYAGNGQCIPIGDKNLVSTGDIVIDGSLCFTNTPVTFYAMGEVKLLNGSVLPPNVTVVKGLDNPCGSLTPTEADPTNLCNSTTYTTLSQPYRIAPGITPSDTLNKKPGTFITNVSFSPNPASNQFVVGIEVIKKTSIRIDVFNSLSQLQPTTSLSGDIQFERGKYNFRLSSDMLPTGIYFVKITAGKDVVTRKLIIQR